VEPEYEPDEEEQFAAPDEDQPSWLPEPYEPSREVEEPILPAGVP
jgi:hypothetical protein